MDRLEKQHSYLRIVQNDGKVEVGSDHSQRSLSPKTPGLMEKLQLQQQMTAENIEKDIIRVGNNRDLYIGDSQVMTNSLRHSNNSLAKLCQFAQTEEYATFQQASKQSEMARFPSQDPSPCANGKQILELTNQQDSEFSALFVSQFQGEPTQSHRQSRHTLGIPSKKTTMQISKVSSKNRLEDDISAHGGYTSSQSKHKVWSTKKVDDLTLDQTGITAAIKKRENKLDRYNRKECVLKTKQFQMILPEKPMNTEDLIYASRENKEIGTQEQQPKVEFEKTLFTVHPTENLELNSEMESEDICLNYQQVSGDRVDQAIDQMQFLQKCEVFQTNKKEQMEVTAEKLFNFDLATQIRLKQSIETRDQYTQSPQTDLSIHKRGRNSNELACQLQVTSKQNGQYTNAMRTRTLIQPPNLSHEDSQISVPLSAIQSVDSSDMSHVRELTNTSFRQMNRIQLKPETLSTQRASRTVDGEKLPYDAIPAVHTQRRQTDTSLMIKGGQDLSLARAKSNGSISHSKTNLESSSKQMAQEEKTTSEHFVMAQLEFINCDLKDVSSQAVKQQTTVIQKNDKRKLRPTPLDGISNMKALELIAGSLLPTCIEQSSPQRLPVDQSLSKRTKTDLDEGSIEITSVRQGMMSPLSIKDAKILDASQMKRLIVNIPDSINQNAINLLDEEYQQGCPKLMQMQKVLESKRGCQNYTPRTTKPPLINKLDHKMYQTLATRNFNNQVLEKRDSIEECRRSQHSGGNVRKSQSPQHVPLRYQKIDVQHQAVVKNAQFAPRKETQRARTRMAKITGAMSKSINSNKPLGIGPVPAFRTEATQGQAKNNRFYVGYSIAEQIPTEQSTMRQGKVASEDQNDENQVIVNYKAIQVAMDSESSHQSHNKDYQFRLSFKDSARSKSSVMHDIEKITKFTDEDIRKSLEHNSQKDVGTPRAAIKLKVPNRLNIFFKEEVKVKSDNKLQPNSPTRVGLKENHQKMKQTYSTVPISGQKITRMSMRQNIMHRTTQATVQSQKKKNASQSTPKNTSQDSRSHMKPQYDSVSPPPQRLHQISSLEQHTPELGSSKPNQPPKLWEELFEKLAMRGGRSQTMCVRTEVSQQILKRKIQKPQVPLTSANADFGYKLWFKPDKSTQKLSDARSKSRELYLAQKVCSSRSNTIISEAQRTWQNARKHKTQLNTVSLQQTYCANEFSRSKIASTISCDDTSSQESCDDLPLGLNKKLDQSQASTTQGANKMKGLDPGALKKLKKALNQALHSPKLKSGRTAERESGGILHEKSEELNHCKNLELPEMLNELISKKQQGLNNRPKSHQRGHRSVLSQQKSSQLPAANSGGYDAKRLIAQRQADGFLTAEPSSVRPFNRQSDSILAQRRFTPKIKSGDHDAIKENDYFDALMHKNELKRKQRMKVDPYITIQRRSKTMQQTERRQIVSVKSSKQAIVSGKVSNGPKAFVLRKQQQSASKNCDQNHPLTPQVLSYFKPVVPIDITVKVRTTASHTPTVSNGVNSGIFKRVVMTKTATPQNNIVMQPRQPKRSSSLNKYGNITSYSKAYPTPLGKYLQRAEEQKQTLLELDRHVARNPRLTQKLNHKQEPIIMNNEASMNFMASAETFMKKEAQIVLNLAVQPYEECRPSIHIPQ